MKIYVDGSGKGSFCYFVEETKETLIEHLDGLTSNEAEYHAVHSALTDIKGDVDIYSDSQLVVNQLNHEWSIRKDRLRMMALNVWKLCRHRNVTFNWIPREMNKAGKLLG